MQTKYQTSTDKMDLESCLWQIFTILKLKPFGKTIQLQWVSLFPLFPAWHKQLTPNLLLPQLHNESSQWHPGKEIGWGIMGCHSNGLSIKKTRKNPQNTAPLWLSMRLNHLRSTLPLFLSFSTTALCASKPRNHRIHLPCPALRCNSLLSLFGQAEEEEGYPGRVWQLMLFLWGEINCKLDCAPSSEFSLIYRILPLFTHSKGSYNFKSLKPAILTPKHALTELPEGKVALEIFFWQCIFNCSSLQKQNNFHFLQNNPYVHFCVHAIECKSFCFQVVYKYRSGTCHCKHQKKKSK